jgi:protein phosphatase
MSLETTLELCALTETGQVRSHNEDNIFASRELGLAVVADGMGGYQAGEVASEIAVRVIADSVRESLGGAKLADANPAQSRARFMNQVLRDAVVTANREIFGAAAVRPEYYGMGTTVVAALFSGGLLSLANVGDSRAYRLRDGELCQMSADHSVIQEFVSSGLYSEVEARARFNTNLVTRALGVDTEVEVDLREERSQPDDLYLLCSDGLTDMVPDEQIEAALISDTGDLTAAAEQLVSLANQAGGRDNISLILVRVNHVPGE